VTKLRIAIADDHPLFRYGVRTLLDTTTDIEVVGEAGDAEEALALAVRDEPDVMLLDVRMPGISGLEAMRRILASRPGIRILILSMFEDDASVFTAMRNGAMGYLLKDASQEVLLRAIRAAAAGEAIFSPGIAARMMDYFAAARPAAAEEAFPELGSREREVLYLMAEGSSNADIARRLGISGKTVANYVTNILNKLHAADRLDAVRMAKENRRMPPSN